VRRPVGFVLGLEIPACLLLIRFADPPGDHVGYEQVDLQVIVPAELEDDRFAIVDAFEERVEDVGLAGGRLGAEEVEPFELEEFTP
jgi:hypothetical protein